MKTMLLIVAGAVLLYLGGKKVEQVVERAFAPLVAVLP